MFTFSTKNKYIVIVENLKGFKMIQDSCATPESHINSCQKKLFRKERQRNGRDGRKQGPETEETRP